MGAQTLTDFERLNADRACVTLDRDVLHNAVEAAVGDPAFARNFAATHLSGLSSFS